MVVVFSIIGAVAVASGGTVSWLSLVITFSAVVDVVSGIIVSAHTVVADVVVSGIVVVSTNAGSRS